MSTVTCTIDGKEVTVPKGTTILEAARTQGVEIPHFCYHPALTIAANCRMCLVEVETPRGKTQLPACHATVAPGMIVHASSARTKELQQTILEFILVNHPVDCPVCDQAGECRLQDYYRDYSSTPSRLDVGKVKKPKAKVLGPNVVLDAERCILCTRCVRFTEEISKDYQLQTVGRGNKTQIDTFEGEVFDSKYSLNTVDICPVGALTSRDFRFKQRVWLLKRHETVCTGCSRGCAAYVDHNEGKVYRYVPRFNPYVNDHWMCDEGRLSFHEQQQKRMPESMVRDGKVMIPADLDSSIDQIGDALELVAGGGKVGVLFSPTSSNEDIYVMHRFAKEVLGAKYYVGGRAEGEADKILIQADRNPNRLGLETIVGKAVLKPLDTLVKDIDANALDVLFVMGEHDLATDVAEKIGSLTLVIALTNEQSDWLLQADRVLATPQVFEYDGTFVSSNGRVQRFERAVRPARNVKPAWDLVCRLAKDLKYSELAFDSVRSVFKEISVSEAPFNGMKWKRLRPFGATLAGHKETKSPTIHDRAGKH